MKRAVFLDKDGTLVEDVPYNVDPAQIHLAEGAGEALRALHSCSYELYIITNQAGVARGFFPEEALQGVEEHLRRLLLDEGVPLGGFYYCPHFPEGNVPGYAIECVCRKPAPGLIYRAASEHGINLALSWFVGDILNDVEAGRRAGCKTILLDNGNETEWQLNPLRVPDYVVSSLVEASQVIVAGSSMSVAGASSKKASMLARKLSQPI